MTADALLERLDSVRATGRETWLARCPGHQDDKPSLSVRELPDGRVLVHCFAGCGVEEVLAAVGLDFDALFPPRAVAHPIARERLPFPAFDMLRALADEALIVLVVASRAAAGEPMTAADAKRVALAADRFMSARELLEDVDGRAMTRRRRHQFALGARAADETEAAWTQR